MGNIVKEGKYIHTKEPWCSLWYFKKKNTVSYNTTWTFQGIWLPLQEKCSKLSSDLGMETCWGAVLSFDKSSFWHRTWSYGNEEYFSRVPISFILRDTIFKEPHHTRSLSRSRHSDHYCLYYTLWKSRYLCIMVK